MIKLLIIVGFVVFIVVDWKKKEKIRCEKIIDDGLNSKFELYKKLSALGLTEQEMIDKCYILKTTMNNLRQRGMI
jgi:hypothetical protein